MNRWRRKARATKKISTLPSSSSKLKCKRRRDREFCLRMKGIFIGTKKAIWKDAAFGNASLASLARASRFLQHLGTANVSRLRVFGQREPWTEVLQYTEPGEREIHRLPGRRKLPLSSSVNLPLQWTIFTPLMESAPRYSDVQDMLLPTFALINTGTHYQVIDYLL
ncbi:hypothetical protein DdX_15190 [Ditylenchus destructor]|uniref:Uncharacterized protein n=1 Tax=Ditylenchus destructor TaxID=166010 RepID=A0AAD4MT84_9BILA|nr:hypothetical protein DdX_15190 [Ditylenchus destructor]